MFKSVTFWSIVVCVLIVLFLVAGCEPEHGDVGPTKKAMEIKSWTDNVRTGRFWYIDMFGNAIEQEGVRFNLNEHPAFYFSNNGLGGLQVNNCPDEQHISSTGITGDGGACITLGVRDDWTGVTGFWVRSGMTASNPTAPGVSGKFGYFTLASSGAEQASITSDGDYDYVASASVPTNTLGLTVSEYSAVTGTTVGVPSSGLSYTCSLVAQKGKMGAGYCKKATSIMPINLSDTNDYLRYAGPFMYSYIVKTASPANIVSDTYSASVTTNACPDGICVEVTVIASSEDKQTHVARTERFLPVDSDIDVSALSSIQVYDRWTGLEDPNIWDPEQYDISVMDDWLSVVDPNLYADPNIVPDPNVLFDPGNPDFYNIVSRIDTSAENFEDILIPERIMSIKIIPLGSDGDLMRIRFDPTTIGAIMKFSESWLTPDATLDINGDGIVNLKDLVRQ